MRSGFTARSRRRHSFFSRMTAGPLPTPHHAKDNRESSRTAPPPPSTFEFSRIGGPLPTPHHPEGCSVSPAQPRAPPAPRRAAAVYVRAQCLRTPGLARLRVQSGRGPLRSGAKRAAVLQRTAAGVLYGAPRSTAARGARLQLSLGKRPLLTVRKPKRSLGTKLEKRALVQKEPCHGPKMTC